MISIENSLPKKLFNLDYYPFTTLSIVKKQTITQIIKK